MKKLVLLIVISSISIFTACQKQPKPPEMQQHEDREGAVETSSVEPKKIETILKDKDNIEIGKATLTEDEDGVVVHIKSDHLAPGSYGIHIHEHGECEGPEFETAGGHFNPDNRQHGFYNHEGPHKGDMENLKVDEEGIADQTYVNQLVTLDKNKENSLLADGGTSIVIHENQDDYVSQPAGNAGKRMYCGVIKEKEKE